MYVQVYIENLIMKKLYVYSLLLALSLIATDLLGQAQPIQDFDKVVLSPYIALELVQGDQIDISFDIAGVDEEEVMYDVSGGTLRIYLERARTFNRRSFDRNDGYMIDHYRNADVTAYVTYRTLRKLIVKGDDDVNIRGTIDRPSFLMRVYGDCNVYVEDLRAEHFKAGLYGDNKLTIERGDIGEQVYALFGDNRVNAYDVETGSIRTTSFGDNTIKVKARDFAITSFGDGEVALAEGTRVRRKFSLGDMNVRHIR